MVHYVVTTLRLGRHAGWKSHDHPLHLVYHRRDEPLVIHVDGRWMYLNPGSWSVLYLHAGLVGVKSGYGPLHAAGAGESLGGAG